MATTKPAKPMAVKSAATKAGKRSTVVTFCICVLTVVDLSIAAGGTPSLQDHVVKLDMKCPRLGGVAIGEPMVGGVFRDSYKRHEFGQWEEDSTWCVRQEEPVLGFVGNVNVRVDGTGKVYGLEISDSIEINRDAEDITERLLGLLLQHQKVIVSELRLDERLIGTNCCSKVELRGMTAYDIFQDVVKFWYTLSRVFVGKSGGGPSRPHKPDLSTTNGKDEEEQELPQIPFATFPCPAHVRA